MQVTSILKASIITSIFDGMNDIFSGILSILNLLIQPLFGQLHARESFFTKQKHNQTS